MFVHSLLLLTIALAVTAQERPPPATLDVLLYKRGFQGGVFIGTPGSGLRMALDTIAELTWVTNRYQPDNSSTYTPVEGTFEGYYWGRNITGSRARDTYRRSASGPPGYVIDLGVTNLASNEVGPGNVDGVLGFGGGALSFFEQASGYWPAKVAGIRYPTTNQAPGVLNLGYTNASQYTGELKWIDTLDNGVGWRVQFGGIATTGNRTENLAGQNFAIWDSTEETSGGPHSVVTAIYGKDPRINKITQIWTMPCDLLDGTTVRIRLGGKQFILSKASLLRRDPSFDPADNQCIGNFAVGEDNNVHLGLTFMRTWYTALSGENSNRRVGLARPIFFQGATMDANDGPEA